MPEIDLLDQYPKSGRDIDVRVAATEKDRTIARRFGAEYFDGPRRLGYGGYTYDPRFWTKTVKRFQEHYDLAEDASILDVGCAKGYMLHDFKSLMPKAHVAGVDISEYALSNAIDDIKPFLKLASAAELPFKDDTFDLVISITTIHNLSEADCFTAVQEIERVSKRHSYIVVGAYRNAEEKQRQEIWNLTQQVTDFDTSGWTDFFYLAKYSGDYAWFIP